MPTRVALAVLFIATALAACGAETAPDNSSAQEDDRAVAGDQPGWWLYEEAGYHLVDGGLTPEDISESTGSLWRLEYSDSRNIVLLSADRADSLFAQLSAGSPQVGTATVDGMEAVLRQHPGAPDDGIPPSVGAEWIDGEIFLSFGGGLTEEELRDHLSHVSRVPRAEWEAAVEVAQEKQRRVREDNPPDTTAGLAPD